MNENLHDLIYDWNTAGEQPARAGGRKIEFDDETLRDGLQSPSVTDPSLDEKVRALHYMNDIGVDSADIGLPGAGPHDRCTCRHRPARRRPARAAFCGAPGERDR